MLADVAAWPDLVSVGWRKKNLVTAAQETPVAQALLDRCGKDCGSLRKWKVRDCAKEDLVPHVERCEARTKGYDHPTTGFTMKPSR